MHTIKPIMIHSSQSGMYNRENLTIQHKKDLN